MKLRFVWAGVAGLLVLAMSPTSKNGSSAVRKSTTVYVVYYEHMTEDDTYTAKAEMAARVHRHLADTTIDGGGFGFERVDFREYGFRERKRDCLLDKVDDTCDFVRIVIKPDRPQDGELRSLQLVVTFDGQDRSHHVNSPPTDPCPVPAFKPSYYFYCYQHSFRKQITDIVGEHDGTSHTTS